MQKFLLIGLGNIGLEYAHTRHNIGFDAIDFFMKNNHGIWQTERLADIATCTIKGRKVIAVKPNTYMNLSGKAIKYYMDKERINIDNMVVIVDDIHIPLSHIKLRISGSHGGHNGLKSIESSLQTIQYPRLRCGIGNNYPKGKQADFVLGKWLDTEIPIINTMILHIEKALHHIIFLGTNKAMNMINTPDSNNI